MSATIEKKYNFCSSEWQKTNNLILIKVIPLLLCGYIISFLDRTNIAFAKEHLSIDLGISTTAYGIGAGLFFLTYALLEIPSNMVMNRVGPRFWMTRILITWGIISASMAFVQGETSFYLMRLLLGAAEAGFFPGVMYYLTFWFQRKDRARATGYFLLGASLATVIGAPLASFLMQLDGIAGLHGWQWLFIIEGLPSVFLGYVFWRKLPNRPIDAKWLDPEIAQALEEHLKKESEESTFCHSTSKFLNILKDRQLLLVVAIYFIHQMSVYSVVFYMPSIVHDHWENNDILVGFLVALPWLCSVFSLLFLPRFATSAKRSRWMMSGGLLLMGAGLLMAGYFGPILILVGFSLNLSMHMLVQSIIFQFPASRLKNTVLASGLALVNCCGLFGGFAGPTVMGFVEKTTGNSTGGLIFVACLLILSSVLTTLLRQGHEKK